MSIEILFVDDDKDVYLNLLPEIEPTGLGTLTWMRSQKQFRSEFLEQPTSQRHRFRLAIIDVNLTGQPGDRSGLDLFRELRETDPAIPVIITTGFHDDYPGIELEVRALGGVFVSKDLLFTAMAERIMQATRTARPQGLGVIVPRPVQIILDLALFSVFAGITAMMLRLLLLFATTGVEVMHPYLLIFLLVGATGMCLTALLMLIGAVRRRTYD